MLLQECIEWLRLQPGRRIVDGTLGGGGHSRAIAQAIGPKGVLLGIDRDAQAVRRGRKQLPQPPCRLYHASFRDLPEVFRELELTPFDGLLVDLGLSSDQLADRERGFSFQADGELDLRFDVTEGDPAWRLLDRLSEKHLADLIYRYGEERFSRRIARKIVARREARDPVRNAADLAALIKGCVPAPKPKGGGKGNFRGDPRRGSSIHPATRTFQALRIAVNDELGALEALLRRAAEVIRPGGRVAIISFHSLEDRRVKEAFRDDSRYNVLTRKPIIPKESEILVNPRSRSARLRVAEVAGASMDHRQHR